MTELDPNKKYKVIDNDLVNGYIILTGKQIQEFTEEAYKKQINSKK